jgi:serine/threonine-protein kinase
MGLAKFSKDHHPSISAIHDDSVVGTADYLAPEQARNSQNVDARADVYGLGCTFYFTLTGQPPFPDGSIAQRLLKHQNENPQSIYEKRPEIPPVLVELCGRMMKKSADQRIQTAAEVALELRRWLASRGKSLSAVYAEATSSPVSSTGNDESDRGWKRATRFTGSPTSGGGRARPSDTVSSSRDDTNASSSGSSINDDLTLAPLDEEKTRKDSGSVSSSSVFKTTTDKPRVVKRSEESSSGIFDTASAPVEATYDSGPLDALLDDPSFSSGPQLPKTQLLTRRERRSWDWKWYSAIIASAIAAIVVGFLLVSLLLS